MSILELRVYSLIAGFSCAQARSVGPESGPQGEEG